jgi:hypothetical protein
VSNIGGRRGFLSERSQDHSEVQSRSGSVDRLRL